MIKNQIATTTHKQKMKNNDLRRSAAPVQSTILLDMIMRVSSGHSSTHHGVRARASDLTRVHRHYNKNNKKNNPVLIATREWLYFILIGAYFSVPS